MRSGSGTDKHHRPRWRRFKPGITSEVADPDATPLRTMRNPRRPKPAVHHEEHPYWIEDEGNDG